MKYLLDTDMCIYLIKRRPESVIRHLAEQPVGDVGVSAVTVAELQYGVARSAQTERNAQALELFLAPLVIAGFDAGAATAYGVVRAALERSGTPIGALDALIAAHALSLGATLVTHNTREFGLIPGLALANWAAG